jgi:ATP phosphoribosyltransferase regulatory subunit
MIYQPPAGARDLLPLDVAQKRWIEQRLQQVFHRWSYHRIITPTLERLETLMAGGAIQPETVIQLRDAEEGMLGLRPELTASIARAAVTRMAGAIYPQRLYYNANIFRRQHKSSVSGQQEFFQAGVELLGGTGLLADAEILLLLADCLTSLDLKGWHLILGEAELTRSLLSPFPASLRDKVRQAIADLDRVTLTGLPLAPELKTRALFLLDLRGKPADVLQQVVKLNLEPAQQEVVNNLKSLVELLGNHFALTLDLSLIQTWDYYTGIVFEVIGQEKTGQRILGQGGRYDQLLSLYHPQGQSTPGIGFSLNIEDLHQVLLPTDQLPRQTPASDWLVVPENPQAFAATFAHAQHLRSAGLNGSLVRVEVDLALRSPAATREYARCRQIPLIAWVSDSGSPKIESVISE